MPSQWITAILPPKDYIQKQGDQLLKEVKSFMQGEASRILLNDFKDTIDNWEHAPKFVSEYSEPYGTRLEIYVHAVGLYTTQWQRVSDGTGPRKIVSTKGIMKFQPEYDPKTTPGGKYGGSGRKSGPWRQAWVVGTKKPHRIEPREFSKKIKEKREKELLGKVQQIVARIK